ncbi:hypothetical protein ACFL0V_01215 [Nanoarchaeota archaeon]
MWPLRSKEQKLAIAYRKRKALIEHYNKLHDSLYNIRGRDRRKKQDGLFKEMEQLLKRKKALNKKIVRLGGKSDEVSDDELRKLMREERNRPREMMR